MTDKTPHPHAELIAEWVKDTSKIPERLYPFDNSWHELAITFVIEDIKGRHNYRLKPEEPPKPVIVSSLSGSEIHYLCQNFLYESDRLRAVADAAAQRAIEDLKLPDWEFFDRYGNSGKGPSYQMIAVRIYLEALKKGEL